MPFGKFKAEPLYLTLHSTYGEQTNIHDRHNQNTIPNTQLIHYHFQTGLCAVHRHDLEQQAPDPFLGPASFAER